MKVKLIAMTPQPEKVMWVAARTCYSPTTPSELWDEDITSEKCWELIEKVLGSHHYSIAEHINFTFAIDGISRNCSHQLVRHRHCTFSQASQRYITIKEDSSLLAYYIDYFDSLGAEDTVNMQAIVDKYFVADGNERILLQGLFNYLVLIKNGVKTEDARAILPGATKTNLVMTTNLRNLMHMCDLRLCTRAQLEIRQLFKTIVREVKSEDIQIGKLLMTQCERLGYCPEHSSCGKMPSRGN